MLKSILCITKYANVQLYRAYLARIFFKKPTTKLCSYEFQNSFLKNRKTFRIFFPEISKLCSNVCLNLYLNLDYIVVALETSFIIKTFLCGCCGQMLFFINLVKTFLMSKMSSKMYVTWSGLNFDKWKTFS